MQGASLLNRQLATWSGETAAGVTEAWSLQSQEKWEAQDVLALPALSHSDYGVLQRTDWSFYSDFELLDPMPPLLSTKDYRCAATAGSLHCRTKHSLYAFLLCSTNCTEPSSNATGSHETQHIVCLAMGQPKPIQRKDRNQAKKIMTILLTK